MPSPQVHLFDPSPHQRVPHPSTLLTRRGLLVRAGLGATATATATALVGGPASAARHRRGTSRPMPRLTLGADGTVRRRGKRFRAGGVNAFQLVTNDYPAPRLMARDEIDSLFAAAVALEVRVVRAHTLGASVGNPFTLVRGVSGSGPRPTITYDQAVWDVIDYAVWKARQLGIYLVAPFVDELGWYHGGKRHWVDFRRPGTVSLDPAVTAASSPGQRAGEDAFYTDPQIGWDFDTYVRDWLTHVNPLTGTAFKDEPVLSVVQIGNELWTAAQDAPGWVAAKARLVKSIAPRTLVMDSGADGLAVEDMAWASPDVDILETHPYDTFDAGDVRRMAKFAARHHKAFAVGEYPWTKRTAPAVEAAVRGSRNVFTSAPWSLQNPGDLHNQGAVWGDDDVAMHLPAPDDASRAALVRVTAHHRALEHGGTGAGQRRAGRRRRP